MKQQKNKNHPRIKNRSEESQAYRDKLAKDLNDRRADTRSYLAKVFLKHQQNKDEYIAHVLIDRKKDKEFASQLIKERKTFLVISNITKFKESDQKDIICQISHFYCRNRDLYYRERHRFHLNKNLRGVRGLDKNFALNLIKENWIGELIVIENLEIFIGLDKEVALKLIEKYKVAEVAANLDKFIGLDKEVALKLIEKNKAAEVVANLDKFQGFTLVELLKELRKKPAIGIIIENADKFEGLFNYNEIFLEALDNREGTAAIQIINKLEKINPNEILSLFIDHGCGQIAIENLNKFKSFGLEFADIVAIFTRKGKGNILDANPHEIYTSFGEQIIETRYQQAKKMDANTDKNDFKTKAKDDDDEWRKFKTARKYFHDLNIIAKVLNSNDNVRYFHIAYNFFKENPSEFSAFYLSKFKKKADTIDNLTAQEKYGVLVVKSRELAGSSANEEFLDKEFKEMPQMKFTTLKRHPKGTKGIGFGKFYNDDE